MKWTDDEKTFLRKHYEHAPMGRLRAGLRNRRMNTIVWKAMAMKLPRRVKTRDDGKRVAVAPLLRALRKRRKALGIFITDLAKRMGYHYTTVAGWEAGRNVPTFRGLLDWCDALGVSLVPTVVAEAKAKPATSRFTRKPPKVTFENFDRSDAERWKERRAA